MDVATLLSYAAAHAALTAAPGPVTAIVLSRTLTADIGGAVGFAVGVCFGKIVAIIAIASGIGLWAGHSGEWLRLFRMAGAGYILFLAVRMWRENPADAGPGKVRQGWIGSTTAGTVFSAGSPYTFFFYLLFLPSVAPLGFASPSALAAVLLVTVGVVGGVLAVVIVMTQVLGRFISTPVSSALFRRFMALLLGSASLFLLAS